MVTPVWTNRWQIEVACVPSPWWLSSRRYNTVTRQWICIQPHCPPPPPPHHLPVLKDLLHSHYRWLSKTPVPNISKLPCHIVTNVLFSKHAHTKRRLLLQRQHDDSLLSCVSHWWSHIWAAALNQTVAWVATGDWRADFWAARQTSTWQISVWASYRLPPLWPLGAPLYTLLTLALTP